MSVYLCSDLFGDLLGLTIPQIREILETEGYDYEHLKRKSDFQQVLTDVWKSHNGHITPYHFQTILKTVTHTRPVRIQNPVSPKAPYTLIRKIGNGAYGHIYHIQDTHLQDFALKLFTDNHHDSKLRIETILNISLTEYYYSTQAICPNIITVYQYIHNISEQFTNSSKFYLPSNRKRYETGMIMPLGVMDLSVLYRHYYKGHNSLKTYIIIHNGKEYRIDWIGIVQDIIQAIKCYHDLNRIHLDIKPENIILIESDGYLVPQLIDFSISEIGNRYGNRMKMTQPYRSPEIHKSIVQYNHSMDIWSLGILLREIETGIPEIQRQSMTPVYEHYWCIQTRSLISQMLHPEPSMRPTMSQIQNVYGMNSSLCIRNTLYFKTDILFDITILTDTILFLLETISDKDSYTTHSLINVFDIYYRWYAITQRHNPYILWSCILLTNLIEWGSTDFQSVQTNHYEQLYFTVIEMMRLLKADICMSVASFGKSRRELLTFIQHQLFIPNHYLVIRQSLEHQPENHLLSSIQIHKSELPFALTRKEIRQFLTKFIS